MTQNYEGKPKNFAMNHSNIAGELQDKFCEDVRVKCWSSKRDTEVLCSCVPYVTPCSQFCFHPKKTANIV